MSYEYPTRVAVVRLNKVRRLWTVGFNGRQSGRWHSPDAAAAAVAGHESGLPEWDQSGLAAPADLLDWRPLGDSL